MSEIDRVVIANAPTARVHGERRESIVELAEDLGAVGYQVTTELRDPEAGRRGVTWWEITYLFVAYKALDVATTRAVDAIFEVVTSWAKRRVQKKEGRRPEYVAIFGPDGEVLRSVKVEKGREPIDLTADDRAKGIRRQPPSPLE